METVSGSNNWKLVVRRESAGITVLQAYTCDRKAALPEELFGLPVTSLAHHALTPGRTEPDGEPVRITCGPSSEEWDNRQLEDLTLPDTLVRAGDYAFFNCGSLKVLRLSDRLRHWGGGTLMNCRHLDTFYLRCSGAEGEVLAYLADELSQELDVMLLYPNGEAARLIFPEYAEIYEENVPHHQFDFHIGGAGYPYHHCFYQKQFSFQEYDRLWKGFLGMGYEESCAMRLAWWRLRYPMELRENMAEEYLAYLRVHVEETARWLLERRDAEGLQFLLKQADVDKARLEELCDTARRAEQPEAVAVLLEEQHRRFPMGAAKTFDL